MWEVIIVFTFIVGIICLTFGIINTRKGLVFIGTIFILLSIIVYDLKMPMNHPISIKLSQCDSFILGD